MTMTLNPLSLLEKAINEHGSATILKERIDLVRDQLATAEKKLSDAMVRITQLTSTNEELCLQVQQLQTEINNLNHRLNPPSHDNLPVNENAILNHLAMNDGPTVDDLATALNLGPQTIELHLSHLNTLNLVESSDSYLTTHWRLTMNGKNLMAQRGVLH